MEGNVRFCSHYTAILQTQGFDILYFFVHYIANILEDTDFFCILFVFNFAIFLFG